MIARPFLAAGLLMVLAGCDSGGAGTGGPGAVSEGEAQALDEAAEMLDERRLPDGVLPEPDPPSAAYPSAESTGDNEG